MDKLAMLKSIPLLGQIPGRPLSALGELLSPLECTDGAVIFEEGAPGDSLYFVTKGRVRISKNVGGDKRQDLAILGPGDCFGEMALLDLHVGEQQGIFHEQEQALAGIFK